MSNFDDAVVEDEAMLEDWPDPEDWEEEEEEEEPLDYVISFKAKGLTTQEVGWLSRYLFSAIEKEIEIPYSKLEDLEIDED